MHGRSMSCGVATLCIGAPNSICRQAHHRPATTTCSLIRRHEVDAVHAVSGITDGNRATWYWAALQHPNGGALTQS